MGQAWCKEKSEKAQDSKSPLDRVFVRCAHRIYPGLKEDGSVLGGATQRVTSSEIGYAGSPPRAALLRGQSIDSVDRPFHPSEWVDVNLEVPCTPRASVVSSSANQQRSSNLTKSNGRRSPHQSVPTTAGGAPVPPPRRRRRRERRPLPPKPGSGDDESEPEPHYSRLRSPSSGETSSRRDDRSIDEVEGPSADSEDEFVAIERILQKSSLEEISSAHLPNLKSTARPKNHSTTSLPNVAELLIEDEMDDGNVAEDEAAAATATSRRPPRHVKTASLPREASLGAPQTPERMFFSRGIEEDNSIPKIDTWSSSVADEGAGVAASSPDCSLRFETDVKTSTPVKLPDSAARELDDHEEGAAGPSRACQNIDDASHSFQSASSASRDSSAVQPVAEAHHEVDRPAAEAPARSNEDAGYESRNSSHLLSNGSSASGQELARDEMSSGILRDATVDSCDFEDLGIPGAAANDSAAAAVQRTISEESLPREMLVDEEEEEEEEDVEQESFDVEKSAKDASNELTRQTSANESENFSTPPLSPETKSQASSSSNPSCPTKSQQRNPGSAEPTAASAVAAVESGDNLTSMTPSLMELEAALSDMLERKDEEERRASEESGQQRRLLQVDEEEEEEQEEEKEEDKSSDKSPEPQIVPVKRNRPLEDVEADLRKVSPQPATKMQQQQQQQQAGEEERQPAKSLLIDFQRVDRMNPFNDLKSDEHEFDLSTDEPPEKPSRLHRISLIEESIDEPLIVPTPPRRRHRSKSNLNSPSEASAVAEVFRHATYNDRLI
ncbi:nucleolar and coiled-body phosphoprotein 1 [Nasonia vitripennis]|uniref:Uncharacterized protein n=1 Tax=Nasonia vitripennis TaxID=7425 RepID=A0A7M7QBP4_NASVI|nr:nucleolar and coiled-body phosphoprotein 1 [Nasonia vitripennis]XP_031784973.1 nucleolar and coiled-body phosphoprotein 1 [Nasonia vitripennis]XP_031784976.1 nucleolar and coiled-body phosphoprotein 1 [Nasonia vitripennis]XP_031784978.1 nucleolar and coiled-body phosphoprotein 1 [Nasonia vitripennis]